MKLIIKTTFTTKYSVPNFFDQISKDTFFIKNN